MFDTIKVPFLNKILAVVKSGAFDINQPSAWATLGHLVPANPLHVQVFGICIGINQSST